VADTTAADLSDNNDDRLVNTVDDIFSF